MKIKKQTFLAISFAFLYQSACYATTQYSIEYAPSSPIKQISLKDAQLSVELYSYSKPNGYLDVRTDSNQKFSLKEDQDLEVVSIKGEEKYNARCSGYATNIKSQIQITCVPRGND